jgi:hypothetical protein
MRTFTHYIRVLNCAAFVAALAWSAKADAGGLTPTPNGTPVAAPPKSVFLDAPDKGKDPFFPLSVRRTESLPRTVANTNTFPETSTLFDLLQLKGISGPRNERLAIINGTTIAAGELAEIRCSGRQNVKVRCVEIREDSVVVELVGRGQTRELKLRKNI